MLWVLFIVIGFLLGSILFSKLIPSIALGKNICSIGADGNPGAANVFMKCGVKMGFVCLLLDMLKGIIPVFAASLFLDTKNILFSFVMLAPVLGHAVGLFNRFHGGKCISVIFGVFIAVLYVNYIGFLLAAIYIFFSTVVKISPNSRRSIITFSTFIILSIPILIFTKDYSILIGCIMMSSTAIIKHLKVFIKIEEEKVKETEVFDEQFI